MIKIFANYFNGKTGEETPTYTHTSREGFVEEVTAS